MNTFLTSLLLSTCLIADGANELPPISKRFADTKQTEVPDFQRHVVPLFGQLGCNGRACHGSFQGKGGFQLSLFGYDFRKDFNAIQPRVDSTKPSDSLILKKPTEEIDHEGGLRVEKDSWQYKVLRKWIEADAKMSSGKKLLSLDAVPSEIVFDGKLGTQSFKVIAKWQDGVSEDVTCLCRLEVRNDSVAKLNANDHIEAIGQGQTHVIIAYDREVITIPILVPYKSLDRTKDIEKNAYSDAHPRNTGTFGKKIDQLVDSKLDRLGLEPSKICSDEDFLRRIRIDLTGTLPTSDEVLGFLNDSSKDKRQKYIDKLLASPAYAAWWANRLCDVTGNNPFRQMDGRIGHELARQWYQWIYQRIKDNEPYDKLVEGIVLASGRDGNESYLQYAEAMSSYLQEDGHKQFAQRPTMPYFWSRRDLTKPEDKLLAFAHSFMGIRLQCAQCHKHPYDRWTQGDFQKASTLFSKFNYGIQETGLKDFQQLLKTTGQPKNGKNRGQVTQEAAAMAKDGKTIAWREFYVNQTTAGGSIEFLGKTVEWKQGEDPRVGIMNWLRDPDNPYFAKAFVNRVWANYFHRGLIDPVDDLNLANPPSNPELLEYLCSEFVARKFDMKWLHKEIVSSETYQRDWKPNDSNSSDYEHLSRSIPRRLPAEVIYDALKHVTAADQEVVKLQNQLDRRAIGHLATRMAGTYAQKVFGQPAREIACDCERINQPTLLQSIFLQNDPVVQNRLSESTWLKAIEESADPDIDSLIDSAYLRTISRRPTAKEIKRAKSYLKESKTLVDGMSDLLWSLINSKEFILNH